MQASKPVLVDFWATWCGPCKLVLPSVEWIEQEYGDHLKVVKVEADPNPGLMEKYKVLLPQRSAQPFLLSASSKRCGRMPRLVRIVWRCVSCKG